MWCDWKCDHMWYHFITKCDEFGEYWVKTEKCEKIWVWCSNSGKKAWNCENLLWFIVYRSFWTEFRVNAWTIHLNTVLIFSRCCMQLCRVLKDYVFLDWKIRRSRKNIFLDNIFWIILRCNNGHFLSKKVDKLNLPNFFGGAQRRFGFLIWRFSKKNNDFSD